MNIFLESIIFFYVIKHPDLCQNYKAEFFSSSHIQQLFSIVKPFVIDYRECPTETQVKDLVKLAQKDDIISEDTIHQVWQNQDKTSQYSEDWLKENATSFAEWQNLMVTLKKTLSYVKTVQNDVTFENSKEIVEKAKNIFTTESAYTIANSNGHDFFNPTEHHINKAETKTTGYNFIDLCLDGGLAKKTLTVFMAPPKTGKSMWLCNLAANSVRNGQNSVYITLELSYQKVMHRIGANLFEVPINQYKILSDDPVALRKVMKDYFAKNILKKPGVLIVEEFPTSSATIYDIENFILRKEKQLSTDDKPFKFDNVYIDYVNIMRDYKNPNSENLYLKVKNLCEEFRASCQKNHWAGVTVTQVNRSGYDIADYSMSSVSESAGLIMTVDALFGIIQTSMMRAQGVYYIKGIALRDADHMGDRKKFLMNKQFLRITEDMESDIIPEGIDLKMLESSTNFIQMDILNGKDPKTGMVSNGISNKRKDENETPDIGVTAEEITGLKLFN